MSQKILDFCLKYFSAELLILIRGLDLNSSGTVSKTRKYVFYFIQFFANLFMIYFIYDSAKDLSFKDIKEKLFKFSYFSKSCTNFIAFVYFQKNFHKICELLQQIDSKLKPE